MRSYIIKQAVAGSGFDMGGGGGVDFVNGGGGLEHHCIASVDSRSLSHFLAYFGPISIKKMLKVNRERRDRKINWEIRALKKSKVCGRWGGARRVHPTGFASGKQCIFFTCKKVKIYIALWFSASVKKQFLLW